MILIIAKSTVLNEKREGFLRLAKRMEAESRQEAGCISYTLYEDMQEPLKFCFIEQWKDQEAIDSHNNSSHFKDLVPKMAKCKKAPTDIQLLCEIDE